ncbi:toll/interleukin-1 receptor-like protein [Helianthus annuus]|uniref:toll/interleukin-1 receptor-like protein n=1 Tax=Helianthus annuus TaxID=4232 RepID=UPI000B8F3F56|nr:toll/interleukin-1 receptor-like protein [Helianthus annuus]
MASSSTSFIQKSFTYDVFLSFRGKDTRKNFVDHLYFALQQKNIRTFKDDKIKKGKMINDELIKSIKDSKFYIIIFSMKYASSSWCLDELVKIMECHKNADHVVYPIFYDVEPFEVRKLSGVVGKAFAKHENENRVGKWREALKEAANLVGWELKNTFDGHEAKLIQEVVAEISLELCKSNNDEQLIGEEIEKEDALSSLKYGFDDISRSMVKGMGGGVKKALTRVAFDQIFSRLRIVQKSNTESHQHGVIELTQNNSKKKRDH